MNHPRPEIWIAYVYGELSAAEAPDAEAHLRVCSNCKQSVERLRATMAALDQDEASLQWPRRRVPVAPWAPVLRWALAASVVLLAGFWAGRQTGLSRADLDQEIAAARQELQTQFREDLRSMAAATLTASRENQQQLLTDFVRDLRTGLAADRREMLTALETFDQRRALDTEALRAGLLTLARGAGVGFQRTESQLNLLASYLPGETSAGATNPLSQESQP